MKGRQPFKCSTRGRREELHFKTLQKLQTEQFLEHQNFEQILTFKNSHETKQKIMAKQREVQLYEEKITRMRTFKQHLQDSQIDIQGLKSLKSFRITKQEAFSLRKKPKPRSSLGCKILLKKNSLFPFFDDPCPIRKAHSLDKKQRKDPSEVQLFSLNISHISKKQELPFLNFISKESYEQHLNL